MYPKNVSKVNKIKDANEFNKTIDTDRDFKDVLLALYSQVEFLRNQLDEKDLLIRTLIIRDEESQTRNVITHKSRSETSSESDTFCTESVFEFPIGEMQWNNASTVNENIDCN